MKRFAMTVALFCALSGNVLAGNIPTVGTPEPPPSGTSSAVVTVLLTIISAVIK